MRVAGCGWATGSVIAAGPVGSVDSTDTAESTDSADSAAASKL
jgi:hypothetical protein